ncbi:hypothetical protein RJ55_06762 [Drechmeria coniospora]|nr:hypothetical protein RJ55_06762 [Drechmeria coniospora]
MTMATVLCGRGMPWTAWQAPSPEVPARDDPVRCLTRESTPKDAKAERAADSQRPAANSDQGQGLAPSAEPAPCCGRAWIWQRRELPFRIPTGWWLAMAWLPMGARGCWLLGSAHPASSEMPCLLAEPSWRLGASLIQLVLLSGVKAPVITTKGWKATRTRWKDATKPSPPPANGALRAGTQRTRLRDPTEGLSNVWASRLRRPWSVRRASTVGSRQVEALRKEPPCLHGADTMEGERPPVQPSVGGHRDGMWVLLVGGHYQSPSRGPGVRARVRHGTAMPSPKLFESTCTTSESEVFTAIAVMYASL